MLLLSALAPLLLSIIYSSSEPHSGPDLFRKSDVLLASTFFGYCIFTFSPFVAVVAVVWLLGDRGIEYRVVKNFNRWEGEAN